MNIVLVSQLLSRVTVLKINHYFQHVSLPPLGFVPGSGGPTNGVSVNYTLRPCVGLVCVLFLWGFYGLPCAGS